MNYFDAFKKLYLESDTYSNEQYSNEQITERLLEHTTTDRIDLREYMHNAYEAKAYFHDADQKKWEIDAYCLPIGDAKVIYFTYDTQCGIDHVKVDDDNTPAENCTHDDYKSLVQKYADEIAEVYDN